MKTSITRTGLIFLFAIICTSALFAQPESKFGKDSVLCVQNLSLYREYFKQGNHADAMEGWRWVFSNCPKASKYIYLDGVTIFDTLYKKETDAAKKDKYIDTVMMVYDQRIKFFGEEGLVLGKKAVSLLEYRPNKTDDIYSTFKKSVNLQGNNTGPNEVFRYFQAAADLFKAGKITKEEILELYDQLSDIIDDNILRKNYSDSYEQARTNMETIIAPISQCSDLISIYTPKFKANPDSLELVKKIVGLLTKKKCYDTDLYFQSATKLHEKEPSARSALSLARMNVEKKQYSKAMGYFKDAIERDTVNCKKAEYYLEMGDIVFRNLKAVGDAKAYAQKAISLCPEWGKPYILIGNIYASFKDNCQDKMDGRSVYWAATDKYAKAKAIDPSVSEETNKLITNASQNFPSKEQAFFLNLLEGDPFKVECDINESTTIRYRK